MSKLVKRNKKQKGGDITRSNILFDMDSFHDFWKGRGLNPRLTAILKYGLLNGTINYLRLTVEHPLPLPYTLVDAGRGGKVAQYPDLSQYANYIVSKFPAQFNGINISDVEKTTAAAFGIPIDPSENGSTGMYNLTEVKNIPATAAQIVKGVQAAFFQLTDTDLANGNNDKFANIVRVALGDAEIVGDYVHILCDAGFGNMGKVGRASGLLRGIITPQVFADSANTPSSPISQNNPNIYYAPETADAPQSFDSDSNVFTRRDYRVSYRNEGMCANNPTDFALVIERNGEKLVDNVFSTELWTQGPSAELLGSCFILEFLQKNLGFVADSDYQIKVLKKGIENIIKKHGNMVDIWKFLGDKDVDPYLFLDLKRGGDRDQMVAALIASNRFNNLIFCTGDLLCAVAAIINGLPTVYQVASTKTIKVWRKGVGLALGNGPRFPPQVSTMNGSQYAPQVSTMNENLGGGAITRSQAAKTRLNALATQAGVTTLDELSVKVAEADAAGHLGVFELAGIKNNAELITNAAAAEAANGHSEVSDDVVEDENLTAEDLIRDISSQAADSIKIHISDFYPPINNYSQLEIIVDEFNRIIELGTKLAAAGQPPNQNMLTPLNIAIDTLRILINKDEKDEKVLPNVEGEIPREQKYYKDLADAQRGALNDEEQVNEQRRIVNEMLYDNDKIRIYFKKISKDIYGFLIDKYNNNFATNPIFQAFKLILDPYTSNDTIKMGHPAALPAVINKATGKNLYVVGLIALTLINDMISGYSSRKTSVATNIIFGTSYNLNKAAPLDNTEASVQRYYNSIIYFTQSIAASSPGTKYLLSQQVYNLTQSGGNRRIRKTLKRFKIIRRKKHQKTYRKQK